MELSLSRVDYAQVGTTSKKCLQILPVLQESATGQMSQKVAVGSHNGVVVCFSRKKNESVLLFKTLPGPRIECVKLGGALGTPQDKIFVAAGNSVKGFSKKGKQFFAFETNLTEPIFNMYVYGVDMFLCGSYSLTHFHDCQETNYFLCGDRINDVVCLPIVEGSWVGRGITPVIACDDRSIKVLKGSALDYIIEVGGAPNILHLYQNTGGINGQQVLYGTKDGKVGLVELPVSDPVLRWEVTSISGTSAVTALECYDITGDGVLDLIVGKEDGAIDIYVFDENDKPKHRQTIQCNEGITSLQCGRIGSPHYDEIVVCSYAGWVFGMTTEPTQKLKSSQSKPTVDEGMEAKIEQLKFEIEELQARLGEERERYQQNTQQETGLSAVPLFAINDRFSLNKDNATYTLSIELQMAMDYILLQSDVPLDLLDVERNSAVVSVTPCPPGSPDALLATYRCQANTTRLEMSVRSIEGQFGTLQAYIAPRLHPKICQVRQYQIKPLSLHQRCHNFDDARPMNTLKLTGTFTVAEAHSWIAFCLPELPDKPPGTDKVQFYFSSTFLGTQLECTYSKGFATFRSDNVSTVAILRDVLSKEATKRKTRLDMSCDISDESVAHVLRLIQPKLEYQLDLAKKVHLAEALKELQSRDDDSSFNTGEYRDLLTNYEQLKLEAKQQQSHLERIYGIITDLYIDKFKFKGQNVKNKVAQLIQLLDNYDFNAVLQFFQG